MHRAGRLPQFLGEVGNDHSHPRLVVWVEWMAGKVLVSRLVSDKCKDVAALALSGTSL